MQATERTGGLTVRSSSLGCAGRILKNLAHVTLSLRTSHLVKRSVLHSSQASTPQVLPSPAQKAAARRGELRCHATGNGAAAAVPSGPSDYASRAAGVWEQGVSQYNRFMDLAGKFMPMVGLFFLLAFVNTILDSLKDTLVITATGGGAQVIPYLTVYAVFPSSLIFLVLFSLASQRMSRASLFNAIIAVFMGFFTVFAFVLYPNHHLIHPHQLADSFATSLPSGVEGLIGMFRNWTFTLFFCMSELWGDVCLGLLFWGLANDTTTLADAPTLYPLFGLGANVAQALAGSVLKVFSSMSRTASSKVEALSESISEAAFGSEIQALMIVVMGFSVAALALHAYIDRQHMKAKQQAIAELAMSSSAAAPSLQGSTNGAASQEAQDADRMASHASASTSSIGQHRQQSPAAAVARTGDSASSSTQPDKRGKEQKEKEKDKPSVLEIFRVLAASVPIRCLAVMSLAQGLCTSLMEFAWKSHIGLLYPTPSQFTSFLGDVSVWQGVVTGGLMVLSPAMFERMGWKGVAGATPLLLLWGGLFFFAACITYQFAFAGAAASSLGAMTLTGLVYGGALLYVFSKSAKFSLFKPAEEMVYISLDEEGRTKGKAAIDVVGSQAGKSGGSVLQQVLLLMSGGALAGILPVLFACYFIFARGWLKSVAVLSEHDDYGHADSVHASVGTNPHAPRAAYDAEVEEQKRLQRIAKRAAAAGGGSNGNGSSGNSNGSSLSATSNGQNGKNGNGSSVASIGSSSSSSTNIIGEDGEIDSAPETSEVTARAHV